MNSEENKVGSPRLSIPAIGIAQICSWGTLFYSFPQLALALEADLGWLKSEVYLALTIGLLLSAMAAIPVGVAIDKGYGRNIMTGGSILAGFLLILCSQVDSIFWFFIIFSGIGFLHSATLYDAAFAIIAKNSDTETTKKHITSLTLWGGFASTIFIPAMEFVLQVSDWRTLLQIIGLINIFVCGTIYSQLPKRDLYPDVKIKKDKKKNSLADLKWVSQQSIFWSLLICFSLFAAAATAFKFHLYPILVEKGLSATEVVAIIAILGPSQVAGRALMWAFGSKVTINMLGIITASMLPVVFIAVAYLPTEFLVLAPFAMAFGAASGTMTIVKGIAVPELITKKAYGVINGAMNLPVKIIKAFAPTIAAMLWYVTNDYSLLLTVLIFMGIIVVIAFSLSTLHTKKSVDG